VAGALGAFDSMLKSAIAIVVQEQMQKDITELVDDNFSGIGDYPRLKVSRIDPFEQTRNIPEFVAAIGSGAVRADLDTENEIRRRYGFGERDDDGTPPPGPGGDPGEGFGDGGAGGAFDSEAAPQGPAFQRKMRLAKLWGVVAMTGGGPGQRVGTLIQLQGVDDDPDIKEAAADASGIRGRLEGFETQYLGAINRALRDMRQAAVSQIRGGLEPKNANQIKIVGLGDLKAQLLGLLRSVRDFGRQAVEDEVGRQAKRLGKHVALQADPTTRGKAVSFANSQAEVLVNVDLNSLANRLQNRTVAEFNRLFSQGLKPGEIAKQLDLFLKSISDRQIAEMARASTSTSFNLGRNIAVQDLKGTLKPTAIRTEVLDKNTCTPCRALHGKKVIIGSDEYLENLPPAFCEGRKRCRGFYLVFPL